MNRIFLVKDMQQATNKILLYWDHTQSLKYPTAEIQSL